LKGILINKKEAIKMEKKELEAEIKRHLLGGETISICGVVDAEINEEGYGEKLWIGLNKSSGGERMQMVVRI
jgi:hypothetical protein